NNGTASNPNSTGMSFVTGKVGNAVQFDGVDDWVSLGSAADLNMGTSATAIMWIESTRDIAYQIIGKNNAWFSTGYAGWHISTANTPADLIFEVQNGTSRWGARFNTNRVFGWTMIAAVKDGNIIRSYKDGVFQATSTASGDMTNVNNCLAGSYKGTSYFFQGSIDDARFYNRALSVDEIKGLYKAGR
ncbi:MAG: LamG domain-containing protein, partial [Patescibacteria group bacterium]|nr:LamG domain-containing protein [Patescibacteria group bacterium]